MTDKTVSACVGAGNRHPDSSEMYCSKCGTNTPTHSPTETTVDKWDSLENKLLSVGREVEATCISEEDGLRQIKDLLSHSVQEAKAEMIARIEGMRVEDETHSDGKYVYTDYKSRGYNQALDDLLASLKQEEGKV